MKKFLRIYQSLNSLFNKETNLYKRAMAQYPSRYLRHFCVYDKVKCKLDPKCGRFARYFYTETNLILSIYNRIKTEISMTYCNANIEIFHIYNNNLIQFIRTLFDVIKNTNMERARKDHFLFQFISHFV